MKCPKCGGRTVIEDYHTYMGHEVQRKCIMCGKLFMEGVAPVPEVVTLAIEEAPPPTKQSKSIGTCSVCNRPDQYLTRGMCCRDYQRWRKTKEANFIGPPAPPQESHWKKEVFHPDALARHRAKESESSASNKEETTMPAVRGTCIDCKRPDMAIQAHGRCGKCHYAAVKNGVVTVTPRKPKAEVAAPAVPPLQPPCRPSRKS